MRSWTRRDFLRSLLIASAMPGTLVASRLSIAKTTSPKRVIVIGAGLAGLAAAYELREAGHEVQVVEAQSRPGGRVLTLRAPFADSLYADAGAARINAEHGRVLRYAEHFGLTLEPFYPSRQQFVIQAISTFHGSQSKHVDWKAFEKAVKKYRWLTLSRKSDWFKIKGGNDLLPKALAKGLTEAIHYGAPAVKVKQDLNGVRVTFLEQNQSQSLQGDYVVCTLPFSVMDKLEIDPPFSKKKQEAIKKLRKYDSATRVFLQFTQRTWEQQGLNGFAVTNLSSEIWPSSFNQPGTRGILQSYTWLEVSERITRLQPQKRIRETLAHVEKVFPGVGAHFETGAFKCWSEDPWVRGGWANLPSAKSQLRETSKPEGRVYLAGEHISNLPGWMEGALESGARVAQEISQAAESQHEQGYRSSTGSWLRSSGSEARHPNKVRTGERIDKLADPVAEAVKLIFR